MLFAFFYLPCLFYFHFLASAYCISSYVIAFILCILSASMYSCLVYFASSILMLVSFYLYFMLVCMPLLSLMLLLLLLIIICFYLAWLPLCLLCIVPCASFVTASPFCPFLFALPFSLSLIAFYYASFISDSCLYFLYVACISLCPLILVLAPFYYWFCLCFFLSSLLLCALLLLLLLLCLLIL